MSLKQALESGKFVVTAEVAPGKGTDVEHILKDADIIKDRVDAINVTDLQSSVMRLGSMAFCHFLTEMGIDPVFQVTCRDRNRLALQSDLLSAWALGVRNVLSLTGDHPVLGDHPEARPVFELDSVSLLDCIEKLNSGVDMAGNELQGSPDFLPGAVVNPGADNEAAMDLQIMKMEKKIEAGARFFQTQGVYDLDTFEKFMKRVEGLDAKVLGGIILLKSVGMARYMNKNVAGVFVPEPLIQELKAAEDKGQACVNMAVRLVKGMKDLCDGVHIMALGWESKIPSILDEVGL
ncbi:MAG: methylenetetrahydrofolate reductase [Deltaproteobacteria bacterium]|nr:methylenetetrahydrofolate reductase [Deltaproteobacteria bacterium]MBW2258930.1 methylenetetrahydrofolate reductase [Deltaproteobacteria bacterium]